MVSIRNASMDDFEFFYKLKCEDTNIFWTGHDKKPDRECLLSFFKESIERANDSNSRKIYIIEDDGLKVGHLYIIPEEENIFELSTAVLEKCWGKGYAKKAIALGLEEGKTLGFKK